MAFADVINILQIVCGLFTLVLAIAVTYGLYKLYQKFAERPPSRAITKWDRQSWQSMRDMCELMDMNDKFVIETDDISPDFPPSFECVGIVNFYNTISAILVRERGFLPRLELIVCSPMLIEGIGTDTIKLRANGLTDYGIFKKPVYREEDKEYVEDFNINIALWADLMIVDRITPVLQSKSAESIMAVFDLDPAHSSSITKFLERTVDGIGSGGAKQ